MWHHAVVSGTAPTSLKPPDGEKGGIGVRGPHHGYNDSEIGEEEGRNRSCRWLFYAAAAMVYCDFDGIVPDFGASRQK
jgi:hypothetical protein